MRCHHRDAARHGRRGPARAAALLAALLLLALPAAADLNDRVDAGLVVLYPFNEGSGTVVRDQSNNGLRMDLDITGSVTWLAATNGVAMSGGKVATPGAATKVIDALKASGSATFEAWVVPANLTQDGPARILAIATDTSNRNVNLGQSLAEVSMRLLHTGKDSKGRPFLTTDDAPLTTALTHVVHTFDGATELLYLNGVQHPVTQSIAGDFSSWNDADPMALGNEVTGSRPFEGDIRLVAIYDRALTPAEIQQNFAATADVGPLPVVDAGPDDEASPGLPGYTQSVFLRGVLVDNGLPDPGAPVPTTWSQVSGPATVSFADPAALETIADFPSPGAYTLRLSADNGETAGTDDLVVTVDPASATLTADAAYPLHLETDVSSTPTLEVVCPSTQPVDAQYVVGADAAFSDIVFDSGKSPNYVCSYLLLDGLDGLTTFHWTARLRDGVGLWSNWSLPRAFTTLDVAQVVTESFQDGVDGYAGAADADIRGYFPDPATTLNEWNQGAQDVLRTGRREPLQPDEFYRSLLRFDVSTLSDPGSVVNAWLELTGWKHATPTPDFFHGPRVLYRLLVPWGEGTGITESPEAGEVSWTYRQYPTAWSTPGASDVGSDRDDVPVMRGRMTSGIIGQTARWSSHELVEAVREWIASPAGNHGLILMAEDESVQTLLNLASREHVDPDYRPRLVIQTRSCGALPDTTPCDDGNPCTDNDQCQGGTCVGTSALAGTPCPDGQACNGDETCDGAGVCVPGSPPPPPQPVGNTVTVAEGAGGTEITWIQSIEGPQSNVYRGDLLVPWDYTVSCALNRTAGTLHVDPEAPPEDGGFFYLVTAVGECGESEATRDGDGNPVAASPPCP